MAKAGIFIIAGIAFALGCGEGGGAKKAGQKMGETFTDFASGVGKGIDKQMEVSVEISDTLTDLGIRKTVSKSAALDRGQKKAITVYLIASKPVNLSLTAKAQNEAGDEIGRSKVTARFAADDAKYVTFTFDPEMDTQLVHTYFIDGKEAARGDAVETGSPASPEELQRQAID